MSFKKALIGNYRSEHLLSLRHALELYDIYQKKVEECDHEIEAILKNLQSERPEPITPIPLKPYRHRTKQMNEPRFDVRGLLYNILGTDLTQVYGLGPHTSLKLIAECGTDMSRWPSSKHFTSWLTLCPGPKFLVVKSSVQNHVNQIIGPELYQGFQQLMLVRQIPHWELFTVD